MENEHCSNVTRFRASRDITLPYTIVKRKESPLIKGQPGTKQEQESLLGGVRPDDEESMVGTSADAGAGAGDGAGAGAGAGSSVSGAAQTTPDQQQSQQHEQAPTQQELTEALQRKATFGQRLYRFMEPLLETIGKTLQTAHVRDFERRKDKPKMVKKDLEAPEIRMTKKRKTRILSLQKNNIWKNLLIVMVV